MLSESICPEVVYREVPGFPDYRIGSDGTLWGKRYGNHQLKNWRRIKGSLCRHGYMKTILYRPDKTRRYVKIHTLVLEAFVGPCPNGQVCAHNNGIRADNRVENLRWDTQKANIADKESHGTSQHGDRSAKRKLSSAQVSEIRRRRAAGERGVHLAREFRVSVATISAIFVGRNWKRSFVAPAVAA